jgi:hypothetical protein
MNLSEVLSVAVLHVGLRLVETFPATDFQAEHGVPSCFTARETKQLNPRSNGLCSSVNPAVWEWCFSVAGRVWGVCCAWRVDTREVELSHPCA